MTAAEIERYLCTLAFFELREPWRVVRIRTSSDAYQYTCDGEPPRLPKSARYSQALVLRDEGMTLTDIAAELGVSRQRISAMLKNGLPHRGSAARR